MGGARILLSDGEHTSSSSSPAGVVTNVRLPLVVEVGNAVVVVATGVETVIEWRLAFLCLSNR